MQMDQKTYNKNLFSIREKVWTNAGGKKEQRFTSMMVEFSSKKDEDYINEWDVVNNTWDIPHQDQCICSQEIQNNYFIRNRVNGTVLVIGSECINKFGSEEMKDKHKVMKKQDTYSGDRRMCVSCCKYMISANAESWKNVCKSCYKNGDKTVSKVYADTNGLIVCPSCKQYKINKEDSWKKECSSCWYMNKGK